MHHTYCFGKNPFKELLLSIDRTKHNPIVTLSVTKSALLDREVMGLIQSHALTYQVATKEEIEHHVGSGAVHQGVLVTLTTSSLYTSLDEVLAKSASDTNALFVLLDGLEDPHNVGAIIRSSVAFGANAILLPEHHETQITGTVIKSSAGTIFSIPVVRIGNVTSTLLSLKQKGFWVYGLTGDGDTSLPSTTFDTNAVLVVGSEGEGIAKKALEHCDFKLSIPIAATCESLNASNAVAVTLYEWSKQQKQFK